MKKFLSIFMSLILIGTMSSFLISADEPTDIEINGYAFDIDYVDGRIKGEDAVVITTTAAAQTANLTYATYFICEKVEDELYKVKADAKAGCADPTVISLGTDEIVVGIHSDGSENALNLEQKRAAALVKKDMYITLSGIDLVAKTVTEGKATVSKTDPRDGDVVTETITVDGVLDDTGWSSGVWL